MSGDDFSSQHNQCLHFGLYSAESHFSESYLYEYRFYIHIMIFIDKSSPLGIWSDRGTVSHLQRGRRVDLLVALAAER